MQKIIYFFIVITISIITGCTNKKVQLPQIEMEGISEIHNHSSIWIFFKEKKQDTIAVLNKNNKILNTHWIYNIDKRLSMKVVVPHLQEMQKVKNKDSMHKKGGMFNYFSYADIKTNHIALVNFNPTSFVFTEKKFHTKNNKDTFISLDIQNNNLYINSKPTTANQLKADIRSLKVNDTLNQLKITLKYSDNTSYQNYLKTKVLLNKIEIAIDSIEYIYTPK